MTRRAIVPETHPAAEAWAREFFKTLRTTRDPVIGVHWLSKEGSRRALCDVLKALATHDPLQMIATVQEAEAGWDIADQALRELFAEYSERREPRPPSLEAYGTKALLVPHKPKAHTQKANTWLRNIAIAYAVETLASRFGMPPDGARGSASSIVALAMRGSQILTRPRVEQLWKEYAPWLVRMRRFSAHLQAFTEKELAA